MSNSIYHGQQMSVDVGPALDQFRFLTDFAGSNGTCEDQLQSTYTVPVCSVQASGLKGTWTVKAAQAPEIDPKGGIATFLLLAGGLAVIRGRK